MITSRYGSISVELLNFIIIFFGMEEREVIESNRGNNGEQKSASMANLLFEGASKVLGKHHGSRSYSYCRHYLLYFSNYQRVWQSAERLSTQRKTKMTRKPLYTLGKAFYWFSISPFMSVVLILALLALILSLLMKWSWFWTYKCEFPTNTAHTNVTNY